MWQKKLITCLFLVFPFICYSVQADGLSESFIIEDIRLEGLKRFSSGVVTSRLPVTIGEEVTVADSIVIIKNLHKTGYFRTVDVLRDGNVLVIQVQENPTIFEVNFKGFKEVKKDTLIELLNSIGVKKAAVLNPALVEEATYVIEDIYLEKNFYQVKVESVISPLPRNRVEVLYNITEGQASAIRSISINGNEEFSDFSLSRQIELEPKGFLNFLTDNYKFSEQKLETDLDRLRTFYLESGYLSFEVEETQIDFSDDKRDIHIVINVSEGKPYQISEINFFSEDNLSITDEELSDLITQKVGDVYSGTETQNAISAIRSYFKDSGYANTNVQLATEVDEEGNRVDITYAIDIDNVVFVREINIVGNEFTADKTIRRELLQLEKEQYSEEDIESSRRRIRRLGYFSSVRISQVPVSDTEVDLLIEVVETDTGEISFGAGFSTDKGVSYNVGFGVKNIFGTGNDLKTGVHFDDDSRGFDFELDEHYYTKDGVSRHIGINYEDKDAANNASDYTTERQRIEYGYAFPFVDSGTYNVYLAYESVEIKNTRFVDAFYRDYLRKYGNRVDHYLLVTGLNYDSRDAAATPTSGHRFNLTGVLALPGADVGYYNYGMNHNYYYHLKKLPSKPVAHFETNWNYGDVYDDDKDIYPFHERYFLGGTRTLRGYKANSLGIANDSTGDALGGRTRLNGTIELSFPFDYFKNQQLYLVPFIDAGAVGADLKLDRIYSTYGLELRWQSPVGPLRFSYGVPVRDEEPDDEVRNFQFSLSTF